MELSIQGPFRIPSDQHFETRPGEGGFTVDFESEAPFCKMLGTGAAIPTKPFSARYTLPDQIHLSAMDRMFERMNLPGLHGGAFSVGLGARRDAGAACYARSVDQIAAFVLDYIATLASVSQNRHLGEDFAVRSLLDPPPSLSDAP